VGFREPMAIRGEIGKGGYQALINGVVGGHENLSSGEENTKTLTLFKGIKEGGGKGGGQE